mmetsp:Transcript_33147/g.76454  ORF Transcript_33147/g.76454 Transcript_33147/m.76454 type:complete len:121 (-) Transcript_33147:150-512(-)
MLTFVKKFVKIMSAHYPQRSHKTFIINAPRWFGSAFKAIKPLLRESTKKKIEIHSKGAKQAAAIRKVIGDAPIPSDILGESSNETQIGVELTGELEKQMQEFCVKNLLKSEVEMTPYIEA